MNKKYVLSCCSTADLTVQRMRERDIEFVCFHYMLDGKQYEDDLFTSMSPDDFYGALIKGADGKTSQVNVDEFTAYFSKFLEEGRDILHVSLSLGISGVYNAAKIAASQLLKKYPERKIFVVDSLGASSGYGMFMETLADLRDAGMSVAELYEWAEDNKLRLHHWFFSTDLSFYVKGGRISRASGWFGTALRICPLLNMDNEGRLIPRFKIMGKNNVIKEIVKKMEENVDNGLDYDGRCYISHSMCGKDARAVAQLIESRFPALKNKVEIYYVGPTIGSHTGPGTVALYFFGKPRVN